MSVVDGLVSMYLWCVGGRVCIEWVGQHVIAWRCKFIIISV